MNTQPDAVLNDVEIEAIRIEANSIVDSEYGNKTAAAKEAGVAPATFSAFLAKTYTGRNDRVAADVRIWLASRQEQKRASTGLPQARGFIATRISKRIDEVLRWAQIGPDIAVVACGAGVGKTTTCEHYQASNRNVWMATMHPASSGVNTMLKAVALSMGIIQQNNTQLMHSIGDKARGTNGLIIIDEAQHLESKSLDQVRAIHDLYGVGIALVGNESVYSRLEGGRGRGSEFAQLFSRVGMRFSKARPYAEDACQLIAAWDITEKKAVTFLKAISSKPGALRVLDKTLRLATMLAHGEKKPVDLTHLQSAYSRLSDTGSLEGGGA